MDTWMDGWRGVGWMDGWTGRWVGGWGWVRWWVGGGIDRQRADFAHPRREIRHRSQNF